MLFRSASPLQSSPQSSDHGSRGAGGRTPAAPDLKLLLPLFLTPVRSSSSRVPPRAAGRWSPTSSHHGFDTPVLFFSSGRIDFLLNSEISSVVQVRETCRVLLREEFEDSLENPDPVPLALLTTDQANLAVQADSNVGSGCG